MVMFKDVVAATMISKNVTWAEQSDNACPNFDAEAQSAGKLRGRANKRRTWQRRTRGRWAGNGVCNAMTSFDMTTEEGNAGNTSLENVLDLGQKGSESTMHQEIQMASVATRHQEPQYMNTMPQVRIVTNSQQAIL
jgi:hypothetical protein